MIPVPPLASARGVWSISPIGVKQAKAAYPACAPPRNVYQLHYQPTVPASSPLNSSAISDWNSIMAGPSSSGSKRQHNQQLQERVMQEIAEFGLPPHLTAKLLVDAGMAPKGRALVEDGPWSASSGPKRNKKPQPHDLSAIHSPNTNLTERNVAPINSSTDLNIFTLGSPPAESIPPQPQHAVQGPEGGSGSDTLREVAVEDLKKKGKEPHHHPSVADGSLEQDGGIHPTKTVEGGNALGADSATQIPELVTATTAPQACSDKWPALFADGKTEIHFDDRNLWSLSNEIKGWIENKFGACVNWWPLSARREALPDGFSRVNWKCRCGRSLSGIISTARKVRYEQWLSAHNGEQPAQRTGSPPPMDQEADLALAATSGSPKDTSSLPPPPHQSPPCAGETGQGSPPHGQDPTTNERYLLWCVNSGTLRQRLDPLRPTVVRHIRIAKDDKDEQVFDSLREIYYKTRGFWGKVSVNVISEIRYVKFKKFRQDRVTCYPKQDIPHPKDQEYEYCLPDDGQSEIPPIPVQELMEYFHEPSCAGTLNIATESFPKKRNEKIPRTAWGLHACEQPSFWRALVLLGLPLGGTLLFAPYWLRGHPGDLQNAFIPSILFLALACAIMEVYARCAAAPQGPEERG